MKRSTWVVVGVVSILLLAGAAFVGSRLMSDQDHIGVDEKIVISDSGEAIAYSEFIETQKADEYPDTPLDVAGVFVRREDNSLFVGTGNISGVLVDGKWEVRYDGSVIEVVVTHDTLVYEDVTFKSNTEMPSGTVQQVLHPGMLDEIDTNSAIAVWGERRGDRVVAEVIVYHEPS
jgi:hypothetical protein